MLPRRVLCSVQTPLLQKLRCMRSSKGLAVLVAPVCGILSLRHPTS